jgi:hypothetical protein
MGSSSLKKKLRIEELLVPVFRKPQQTNRIDSFHERMGKESSDRRLFSKLMKTVILYNTKTDSLKILRTGE